MHDRRSAQEATSRALALAGTPYEQSKSQPLTEPLSPIARVMLAGGVEVEYTEAEAQALVDAFFEAFPKLKQWQESKLEGGAS